MVRTNYFEFNVYYERYGEIGDFLPHGADTWMDEIPMRIKPQFRRTKPDVLKTTLQEFKTIECPVENRIKKAWIHVRDPMLKAEAIRQIKTGLWSDDFNRYWHEIEAGFNEEAA